ncbi:MAG: hypothetical protein RLZZ262_2320 [Bacteroidota bacterium]|jgi:hypothetical protein
MASIERRTNAIKSLWITARSIVIALVALSMPFMPKTLAQDSANNQTEAWQDDQWQRIQQNVEWGEKKQSKENQDRDDNPIVTQKSHTPTDGRLTKGIGYLLVIGLVVVLVYLLIRMEFTRRDRRVQVTLEQLPNSELEDNIESDFDGLLRNAVQAGKYRYGIRLLFLDTLKWMNENQMIVWKKYKTNGQYASELSSFRMVTTFKQLIWIYELVWFGQRDIEESEFVRLKVLFEQFKTLKDE